MEIYQHNPAAYYYSAYIKSRKYNRQIPFRARAARYAHIAGRYTQAAPNVHRVRKKDEQKNFREVIICSEKCSDFQDFIPWLSSSIALV